MASSTARRPELPVQRRALAFIYREVLHDYRS
jgi:hypothetical protein